MFENLTRATRSYELMTALKKINNTFFSSKKEFNEEKVNIFTSNLLEIVNKMYNEKKIDEIIIPYIFNLYKKVLQKQLEASIHDKTKNPKQKSQENNDNLRFKDPIQIQKSAETLINFFKISLVLIIQDEEIPVKVNINTLVFMNKLVEQGIPVKVKGVKQMV